MGFFSFKQKTLTEEEQKAFQTAISKLYPGEKGQDVYDAFFSYVAARKGEWMASTDVEYEAVVEKYYDRALLAATSRNWNIFMRASMIGSIATLVVLIIMGVYNKFTDHNVRDRLYPPKKV